MVGLSKTSSGYESKMSLKLEEISLNVDFLETFDLVLFNCTVATCIERTTRERSLLFVKVVS